MRTLLALLALVVLGTPSPAAEPPPLKVLFLGDAGHHLPVARFRSQRPKGGCIWPSKGAATWVNVCTGRCRAR